jgi:hypothetical protein
MSIPTTYTILQRIDTCEYLLRFEFFSAEMPAWTKDINAAFGFRSHADAESNAKLILDRLNDPLNRRVGLKSASVEVKNGKPTVGEWYKVNVCRVA